jgi:hypothetical protein
MRIFIGACLAMVLLATSAAAQVKLYKGEESVTAAGYPAVAYFRKGDPAKPLIVFVPGAHNMARIAYGGHDGSRTEDFLDYWLGQKGYSFLALSYPIDLKIPAFATRHPDFNAQAWGQQVAEIARAKVAENGLGKEIIIAAWSMGGKVVQPSFKAARDAGLSVVTIISLAATPGTPRLISYTSRFKMAPSGYADRSNLYAGWLKQLATNDIENGHAAIPEEVFRTEYVGDISVGQQGYGEVYRNGKFELDHMAQAIDYGAFAFEDYPLVTVLENDDPADARHSLADGANWGLYNANMVVNRYIAGNKVKLETISPDRWRALLTLTRSLPERLSLPVRGNHFFFVGQAGAKRTGDAVEEAIQRARSVKDDYAKILGVPVD